MVMKAKFTLIELLVVVAIIGILVSLLLPVLGRARKESRRAVCLGKLKQMSLAIKMYADDNDQYAPIDKDQTNKRWNDLLSLSNYLPSDNTGFRSCPSGGLVDADWKSTLAVNGLLIEENFSAETPYQLTTSHPAETMLLMDSYQFSRRQFPGYFTSEKLVDSDSQIRIARHNGKANTLFIDGHGEARTSTQLMFSAGTSPDSIFWNPEY